MNMPLHMPELGAAHTCLTELRRQNDTIEEDNPTHDEQTGIVTPAVAVITKSDECETKEDEIAAMKASSAEDTAMDEAKRADEPDLSVTPPAQPAPLCSQRKAASYFFYAVVMTVLSVYTALSEGSFTWSSESSLWSKDVVFGLFAVMEASGLAFGVGVSIRQYLHPYERSMWSDTLCEPHIMVFEGILGDGEQGRELVVTGLLGTYCQGTLGFMVYHIVSMLQDKRDINDVTFEVVTVLMLWRELFKTRNGLNIASTRMKVFSCVGLIIIPFMIEVLAAYHFILSSASVLNRTILLLDAVAIVPLGLASIFIVVGPRLLTTYKIFHLVARVSRCRSSCLDFVESINPRCCLFLVADKLNLTNMLDPEENETNRTTGGANASPNPAGTEESIASAPNAGDMSHLNHPSPPTEDEETANESRESIQTSERETIFGRQQPWAKDALAGILFCEVYFFSCYLLWYPMFSNLTAP